MEIKVLGSGCAKCNTLTQAVKTIVSENNIDATIVKEEDIVEIMKYGVMITPALVINEKVVIRGKVPNNSELKDVIFQNR